MLLPSEIIDAMVEGNIEVVKKPDRLKPSTSEIKYRKQRRKKNRIAKMSRRKNR